MGSMGVNEQSAMLLSNEAQHQFRDVSDCASWGVGAPPPTQTFYICSAARNASHRTSHTGGWATPRAWKHARTR